MFMHRLAKVFGLLFSWVFDQRSRWPWSRRGLLRMRPSPQTVRIAAAQPKGRLIDYRLAPEEALARVDESLAALERLVQDAGGT